jgi:hypothetical protein
MNGIPTAYHQPPLLIGPEAGADALPVPGLPMVPGASGGKGMHQDM